jgi:hypothetical protein
MTLDPENSVVNYCFCAETDVFDVNETEIQSHGPIFIIYRRMWVGLGSAISEDGWASAGEFLSSG